MKPPAFDYLRAESLQEALAALAEYGDEAKVIAGGQSLMAMLNMRLLGAFAGIPYSSIYRLLVIAWIGFVVNFLSGSALFTANATTFATQPMFLFKAALIVIGAATAAYLQSRLKSESESWQQGSAVPGAVKGVASAAIAVWVVAIIAGRMTAYV